MKKFLPLLLVVFVWPFWGATQTAAVEQWAQSYNGATSGNESTTCSYKDNSGYTYVTGYNESGTFVLKFDNTGVVTFSTQYVDANNAYISPKIIQTDAAGNIYLAGTKFYGGEYYVSAVKFNMAGTVQWEAEHNTHEGAIFIDAMI
ncbi:MAG TPA: hypothetical protein VD905_18385, partial [Flavobacteriales bacterium]|nr:hypothetical protein [Flavobacteriales bacterium]